MKNWQLKAATTKELASLYGMERKVMGRLFRHHELSIGKRYGYFWKVEQILLLFEKIGPPPNVRVTYT